MRTNIYKHPRGIIDGTDAVDGVIANPLCWYPHDKDRGQLGRWQRLNSPIPTKPFSLDDAKELTIEECWKLRIYKAHSVPFVDEQTQETTDRTDTEKRKPLTGENKGTVLEHQQETDGNSAK